MQHESRYSTFTMHGPFPPNRGADQPRPIDVREGRRASLIYLPRDLPGKGDEERLANKQSLTDPAVASRKSRPKVVAAPPVATFFLVEVPCDPEGPKAGRGTEKARQKKLALLLPR
jgi:hypothetical protein